MSPLGAIPVEASEAAAALNGCTRLLRIVTYNVWFSAPAEGRDTPGARGRARKETAEGMELVNFGGNLGA